MDYDRFNALTRTFASGASRRGLLARLTPGAGVALWLLLGNDDAEAKRCLSCRKFKKGKCRKRRPDGAPCGEGKTCQRGVCAACLEDFAPCTQTSVDRCCSGQCSPVQPGVSLCIPSP